MSITNEIENVGTQSLPEEASGDGNGAILSNIGDEVAKGVEESMAKAENSSPTRYMPRRTVRCQVCKVEAIRYFGTGILARPCEHCGSRMTFAVKMPGDMPVTIDGKLLQPPKAA